MPYLYETHLHTSQVSPCGRSTGAEQVRFYKEKGYQGIIFTDHFLRSPRARIPGKFVPEDWSWQQQIDHYCSGYEDALIEGQKCGLDVFFGWEINYQGDEYLVYGLDKQWLLDHPEMENWTRAQQYEQVHKHGGCVIQAHPFRDRAYIPQILLGRRFCDGIEVANSGNKPYNDAYAQEYAKRYGLLTTAGSDNHNTDPEIWTQRPLMGVVTRERLRTIHDYVRLILSGGDLTPVVPEGRFEQGRAEAPKIDTFWLDERENPVPTGIDWLA